MHRRRLILTSWNNIIINNLGHWTGSEPIDHVMISFEELHTDQLAASSSSSSSSSSRAMCSHFVRATLLIKSSHISSSMSSQL